MGDLGNQKSTDHHHHCLSRLTDYALLFKRGWPSWVQPYISLWYEDITAPFGRSTSHQSRFPARKKTRVYDRAERLLPFRDLF